MMILGLSLNCEVKSMKVALVVNCVTTNTYMNFARMLSCIEECAKNGAQLVVFGEAAITGLINNDDPAHDFPLAAPVPGPMTDNLCKKAAELNVHIATGILEKDDSKLYDSAVLISPTESIVLKYRRMSPGWHGRSADPKLYCEGTEVGKCDTPLGSFAFLICGDLFDEHIRTKVRELHPDWLLHLMARSLEDGSFDQVQWDKEKLEHVEQVKACGTTTLMVNYLASEELEDKNFGGAMVVLPNGEILSELPIGKEGILYMDL